MYPAAAELTRKAPALWVPGPFRVIGHKSSPRGEAVALPGIREMEAI